MVPCHFQSFLGALPDGLMGSLMKDGREQLEDETRLHSRVEIPLLFLFDPLYFELLGVSVHFPPDLPYFLP
jgi:hypothetical protein